MGSSVPGRCWDQQPTDIVGFSPIAVSCAPSSIMFLSNIESPFMEGGGSQLVGPSVGQTMVEESSLFIVERVPEPLQENRGGRLLPQRWMDYRWGNYSLTRLSV